jgi:hypothetical protein
MSLVSPLLYRAPPLDPRTGLLTGPFAQWLAALLERTGGSGEQPTNADLAGLLAALAATVAALPPAADPAARAHLLGGPATPAPSVAPVPAGAGPGATASVAGSDSAGTITLRTAALAAHRSNCEVVRVTFGQAFAVPPIVVLAAANNAAWSLYYGRFLRHGYAASVRLLQDAVSTTGFPLSVGTTSLPSDAAVYTWNYLAVG